MTVFLPIFLRKLDRQNFAAPKVGYPSLGASTSSNLAWVPAYGTSFAKVEVQRCWTRWIPALRFAPAGMTGDPSRLHPNRTPYPAPSAAAIRSRVSGRSRTRAPSAWATALPIVAPAPSDRCGEGGEREAAARGGLAGARVRRFHDTFDV